MDKVLLDTSGLYALLDPDDSHHEQSEKINHSLLERGAALVLSNFILAECHTVVNRRLGPSRAKEFLNAALADFQMERVTKEDELTAHAMLMTTSRQKDLSYFDAVSVAVANRLGITEIFSFDRHFSMMGLKLVSP